MTVTCFGKTSEPQTLAFVPSSTAASGSVAELVGENAISFQNIFPSLASSARPTILEPIETAQQTSPQSQSQTQQSPMETHHQNNVIVVVDNNKNKKKSVLENNLKNLRSSNFCDDDAAFEFPIGRQGCSNEQRPNELAQKMSEYRIVESIVDDNSLPSGTNTKNLFKLDCSQICGKM